MKKKILGGLAVAIITVMATVNLNLTPAVGDLSSLSLANVEALASSENGGTVRCSNQCGGAYCGRFENTEGNSWPVYYC